MLEALRTRDAYDKLRTSLWQERSSFDSHWRELSDWLLPRRSRWYAGDRNRGDRRNQQIIDSTGRFAARTLQSGLHAGLTSPARPWFKLSTPDPELAAFAPVKRWLHDVTQRMQVVFTTSNLYNMLPIVYGDLGVFGTAAAAILEDTRDLFRCYAFPIGSYALGMDRRGLVTTFVREYQLSVRQVVEEFGLTPGRSEIDWGRLSDTVKSQWDQGHYESPVDICWLVLPNDARQRDRLGPEGFPWASVHYERGESKDGRILRRSGFHSFPILAPRWDVTGEDTYGTDCPGMTALGDVKGLQIMQREKAKAIRKMIDPPLVGRPELRTQKTSLLPGDITYVTEPQHGLRSLHEVTLNIEHLRLDIGETQYRIQRAFYEDLFLMMARSDQSMGAARPTAREVEERHEEKLLALGPVLERTNDELLDPLIDRVFRMMDDAGLLPEPPEAVQGVDLKVEYLSIMAQAQKLVGVVGQDRFVASLAPLAEGSRDVLDKVNFARLVDNYGDMLGVDPNVIRTDEEAAEIAQARAKQEQGLQQAQQAALVGKGLKDAAAAPIGTGSALDAMLQGSVATIPGGPTTVQ